MAETDYILQINNTLAEALEQPTLELKRQKLIPLINTLRKIAGNIDFQSNWLRSYDSIINNYIDQGMSRTSAITQGYIEGKIGVKITEEEQTLLRLMLEGYEAVNIVRQIFTGETITYQIGAGGQTTGKILEANVSFDELLPYLYIEHRSSSYSVRIITTQQNVKQMLEQQHQDVQNSVQQLEAFVPGASTLYSAVYRYYTDERLQQKKGNWGNMYEAYRLLLARSKKGNLWKPQNRTIAKAFSTVLSGGGAGGAFIKGGDVLTLQAKGGFGSNATLISSDQAVTNALQELADSLQTYVNSGEVQQLEQLLIRKQSGQKVFREAYRNAKIHLYNTLTTIPGAQVDMDLSSN